MRQVQLAFRAESGGFRADLATFSARATDRGAIRVTPAARINAVPLELETQSIERSQPLPSAARSVRTDPQAELNIDRGVAIEHVRNTAEGLEQSWRFASRPAGGGDLVIHVRTSGQSFAGETSEGLHFIDRKSGLGLRYGEATWIDAQGARSALAVRFARGELELRVPSDLVDRSPYPAVLDPVVSPEIAMDQPYVPSPFSQNQSDVAFDGTNYLVVWHGGGGVVAARVTESGTLLDVTPIQVSQGTYNFQPVVAWEGSAYLVVWLVVDETQSSFLYSVAGNRVSPSGVVGTEFPISQGGTATAGRPCLAVRGPESLVVWADNRDTATTGVNLYGARIAAGGGVMDAADLPISTASGDQGVPAVASNGTDYLVAWSDTRDLATNSGDLYSVRVGADGIPLSEVALAAVPGSQGSPAVASNGSGYFVIWADRRNAATSGTDLYGTAIDTSGNVLDPGGAPIVTSANNQATPDLVWDGVNYLVTWFDNGDIRAGRVTAGGTLLGSFFVSAAPGTQSGPKIALGDAGALVAWVDARGGTNESDIYAARITGVGVLDPNGIAISLATHQDNAPSVASNGTTYLVAWEDTRGRTSPTFGAFDIDIYGVRVDANGTVLDPNGIAISTANANQLAPVIASNGTDYFVAWYDYRRVGNPQPCDAGCPTLAADIYGTRVTAAGAVLDPNGIAINTAPTDVKVVPAVASNGSDYLVSWFRYQPGTGIYASRISAAGAVLDPTPIAISTTSGGFVASTWNGSDYVVVWQWDRPVHGARISSAGVVLDPSGITFPGGAMPEYSKPTVASDGTNTLVAWEDDRSGDIDLYGARLARDGTVLDANGIALAVAPGNQNFPSLTWTGAAYLLVWNNWPTSGIYGTYVSAGGTVLYPEGFIVSPAGRRTAADSLGGSSLVAYFADNYLMAGRIVTPDACNVDSDCAAAVPSCMVGACVGGVCAHQALVCTASDECHDPGTCAVATGACSNPVKADGTACTGGTCMGGVCALIDAGTPDAALPDAALPDAALPDAALPDASAIDAARIDAPPGNADAAANGLGEPAGGCGCDIASRHGGEPSLILLICLLALALLRKT